MTLQQSFAEIKKTYVLDVVAQYLADGLLTL